MFLDIITSIWIMFDAVFISPQLKINEDTKEVVQTFLLSHAGKMSMDTICSVGNRLILYLHVLINL